MTTWRTCELFTDKEKAFLENAPSGEDTEVMTE